MPPTATAQTIYFSTFPVTRQVFHLTPLSMALVNLKPLLPGHILVCPQRVVARLSELTTPEVTDLFATVAHLSRKLEKIYDADALNIAVQDGAAAGQSVPHVHAHIIPRKRADLGDVEDRLYHLMEGHDADLWRAHLQAKGGRFPVPEGERLPRSPEEMEAEAEWLRERMRELD